MADLRVFTYLPNPRLAKVLIAAEHSGASVEVIGDAPPKLLNWLWDFEARSITDEEKRQLSHFAREAKVGYKGHELFKTDRFLEAHPFGNVPAGFDVETGAGVFESNSIMRAAVRCGDMPHELLGEGPFGQSRVDAFLDRALVFARDIQRYLLSGDGLTQELYSETLESLISFLSGLDQALSVTPYIASDKLTLADIAVICELCLLTNESRYFERLAAMSLTPLNSQLSQYDHLGTYTHRLCQEPAIQTHLDGYWQKLVAAWPRVRHGF